MKKKEFMYKCRQVFAAILTASMVVNSVVPASMVYASDIQEESIEESDLPEEAAEEPVAKEEESLNEEQAGESDVQKLEESDQDEEITVASPDEEENEETELLIGEQSAEDGMTVNSGKDSEDTNSVSDLQEEIDALPTVEEYQALTEDEKFDLYGRMLQMSDIYDAMTEEEQAQVNIEKLEALFEVVNGQVEEQLGIKQEDVRSSRTFSNVTLDTQYNIYGGTASNPVVITIDGTVTGNLDHMTFEVISGYVVFRGSSANATLKKNNNVYGLIYAESDSTINIAIENLIIDGSVSDYGDTIVSNYNNKQHISMENVTFQNFTTRKKKDGSYDDRYVVVIHNAEMQNVTFKNIKGNTLEAESTSLTGVTFEKAGATYLSGSGTKCNNITIKDADCLDNKYLGRAPLHIGDLTTVVNNCEITGCKGGLGGCYVQYGCNFKGKIVIENNQDKDGKISNVFLGRNEYSSDGGYFLKLEGLDTDSSRIGVTTETAPEAGKPVYITKKLYFSDPVTTEAQKNCLRSDNSEFCVGYDGDAYLTTHQHSWKYIAKGNSVEAYCETTGCDYTGTEESHEHTVKASLTTEKKAYTGNAYDGLKLDANAFTAATGTTAGTVEYYKVTEPDSTDGGEKLASAPVTVGNYYAKVTVGTTELKSAFTIEKASAGAEIQPVERLVYTGEKQTLVTCTESTGTVHYRLGEDGEWTTTPPTADSADASPYTVYYWVEGDENHNALGSEEQPESVTAAIAKQHFADGDISTENAAFVGTYDKKAHTIGDVQLSGTAEGAEVTYSVTQDGTYTEEKPAFTDVNDTIDGHYTIYCKISKPEYEEIIVPVTVTIKPKPITVIWGNTNLTYNGKEQLPAVSAGGLEEGDTCAVTAEGAAKDYSADAYKATATGVDNKNYTLPEDSTLSTVYTIAKKEIGIEWPDIDGLVYNGQPQHPSAKATGLCGEDSCEVIVKGSCTDAGISTIATATSVTNENYKLPENTEAEFKIHPKSLKEDQIEVMLTGDGITGTAKDGYQFVWDGSWKSVEAVITDKITGKQLKEDLDYSLNGPTSASNIGDYRIILNGDGNYTGRIAINWHIVKAVVHPTISIDGWIYGENAKEPMLSGVTLKGEVAYTYYTDQDCTHKTSAENGAAEEGTVPVFAGDYWVKAVVAETDYYEEATAIAPLKIARKSVVVTPKEGQKKVYGEKEPELTYDAELVNGDRLNGSLTRTEGENAGTYSIVQGSLNNENNPNYDITVVPDVEFTIQRKNLTDDMISLDKLNYQYTGKKITPKYLYHDETTEADGTAITSNDVIVKGAPYATLYGVYTIHLTGTGNYTGRISKTWCISSVQDQEVAYDGEDHSVTMITDAAVTVRFADENGEYTLTEPPVYHRPGQYEYKYQMVIDSDTEFEQTVEGTALLTIGKATLKDMELVLEDRTYGEEWNPSVSGNEGNAKIIYYYKLQGAEDTAYVTEKPKTVGAYTVKAVIEENEFSEAGILTKDFQILPGKVTGVSEQETQSWGKSERGEKTLTLDKIYQNLDGVKYEVGAYDDSNGVLKGMVTVSEDGTIRYELAGTCNSDATVTIPVTITSTNYEPVTVEISIHIDATAPTGKISLVDTDGLWDRFSETPTYNKFFQYQKDSIKKIAFEGNDPSGTVNIKYYIANSAMKKDELDALADSDWRKWTEDANAGISDKGTYIIYAKLTDKFGNTGYLSSDGIVIYEDAQQNTTEIEYVRTSDQNVTAKVTLNGNTVQTVKNGKTVLKKGTDYTVAEDGTITFTSDYLKKLSASDQPYTLTISYAPAGHDYVEEDGNDTPAATTLSLTVTKAEGSITEIGDISGTYNGQAVKAPEYKTTNTGAVTVEYKKASDSDDTYTTIAPSDAGEYTVRITVDTDDNYAAVSATKTFTIAKADPQVTAPTIKSDLVYSGESQALVTAGQTTGGNLRYRLDGSEEWTEEIPSGLDAESYTVFYKVEGNNNYNDVAEKSTTVSISAKQITVSGIKAETKTYDGNIKATLNYNGVKLDGKLEKDALAVTAAGTFADKNVGTDKKVSITDLTLSGDSAKNYVLTKEQQTETIGTIQAKEITVTITPNGGTYAGTITPAEAVLNSLIDGDAPEITLTYTGTANDGTGVNDTEVPELAGTYKVKASITDENYKLSEEGNEADFTVDRAFADLVVAPVAEKYYGDPVFAMTATSRSDGAIGFSSSDENVVTVDQNGKGTLIGAGTATITVSVPETDNYKADQKSVTITVKKTAHQLTVEKERYDGFTYGDQPFTIGSTTGDQESALRYTSSNPAVASVDSNGKVTIKGAGTAEITVSMEESTNHVAVARNVTVTIAPKTVGIQWNNNRFVYDGKEKMPTATITGLIGADQCTIGISGGSKNVGTHTATAVSLSNPNYCLPQDGCDFTYEIKSVSDKAAASMALNAGLKVSQTGSSIGVKWGKVKGAEGYNVYVQYCGGKFTAKSLNQVRGSKNSINVKKVNGKKLNLKKNYKIYVEAFKNVNGKKTVIGRSITAHIVGSKNNGYTNVKGIKLQKKSFTLKPGKSAVIKGKTVKVNRYSKQLSDAHAKEFRYTTSNPSVATVTAGGKIKAVGKGSCTVYVVCKKWLYT